MNRLPVINSAHFRQDNSGLRIGLTMWDVLLEASGRVRMGWVAVGRCRGGSLSFRPNHSQWGVLFENLHTGERVWFHMAPVQVWTLDRELSRAAATQALNRDDDPSNCYRRSVNF